MRRRFQFRLWTIFALTGIAGWGIVALPYWYEKVDHWMWELANRERIREQARQSEEWAREWYPEHPPTEDEKKRAFKEAGFDVE